MPFNVSGGGVLRAGCASAAIPEEKLPAIGRPGAIGRITRGEPDFVLCAPQENR